MVFTAEVGDFLNEIATDYWSGPSFRSDLFQYQRRAGDWDGSLTASVGQALPPARLNRFGKRRACPTIGVTLAA